MKETMIPPTPQRGQEEDEDEVPDSLRSISVRALLALQPSGLTAEEYSRLDALLAASGPDEAKIACIHAGVKHVQDERAKRRVSGGDRIKHPVLMALKAAAIQLTDPMPTSPASAEPSAPRYPTLDDIRQEPWQQEFEARRRARKAAAAAKLANQQPDPPKGA